MLNFDDYLAMPEMERRYEIVNGEIVMSPAPSIQHQWISDDFTQLLREFVFPRGLGIVVSAPVDVLIRREPLRVRQPDVLFVSGTRCGFHTKDEAADIRFLESAPEVVVEIVSPSSTPTQIDEKLQDYASIGVDECWLLHPAGKNIRVLALTSSGYETCGVFGEGETAQSRILKGFSVPVDRVLS